MIITRHGEGTFKIQTGGVAIVVDPTDSRLKPDITLYTSHDAPSSGSFTSPAELIGPGEYDVQGIKIRGFPASNGGSIETVYEVNAEGLSVVFFGNPKKAPDITIREKVGDVDIVVAPSEAAGVVKQLEPLIIIPSHMKTVAQAEKAFGQKVEGVDKVTTKKKDLPVKPTVMFINA